MSRWHKAPLPRDQLLLIETTLGECIPGDHPVRIFWEILDALDFSSFERRYVLVSGQPPIPPKIIAGAILYGFSHGLRSGRRLEWACSSVIEFKWLVEGRTIDHSTFCEFRTNFKKELKQLFHEIGRLAIGMGMIRLNHVALDGTRVKANSSRHATASSSSLEKRLAMLDEQIGQMMAEAEEADQKDRDLFGDSVPCNRLPRELADAKRRQQKLQQALAAAQKSDAKHKGKKRVPKVPVADPDSSIMPNKEGGHAPNYNPIAAVDGESGMIVDADVLNEMNEAEAVIPTVQRIESAFEKKPKQLLADTTFATGNNLSSLAERKIEAVMPVDPARHCDDNPAKRIDPTQPVAKESWSKLPRRSQSGKKLDREAFVYDAKKDCYYCPAGRQLPFVQIKIKGRTNGDASEYRVYESLSCDGCTLASECLSGKAKQRTVSRDQHEPAREELATRMKTVEAKESYKKRAHLAETPNAVIKQVIGVRQFLLRGIEKVRTEWLWACVAFNLRKLVCAQVNGGILGAANNG